MGRCKGALVAGGVDVCEEFGLLLESCDDTPPAVKRVTVEVPGADGLLDLTQALTGDVYYEERAMAFHLWARMGAREFQQVKTRVSNALHGKSVDFSLGWDPGYTYHGRFRVAGFSEEEPDRAGEPPVRRVELEVDADPYKSQGTLTWRVNAAGGITLTLPCGRKKVSPTFEVGSETLVGYKDRSWRLPRGTYKVPELWLGDGDNDVYLNTRPDAGTATLGDYWDGLLSAVADTMLSTLALGSSPVTDSMRLSEVTCPGTALTGGAMPLSAARQLRLVELSRPPDPEEPDDTVYVQFERLDL